MRSKRIRGDNGKYDFDGGERDMAIADFLPRLETVIGGVNFPVSASDHPFQSFVWYSAYQGDFSLTGLLHAEGFLRPVELEEFLERVANATATLPSNLSEHPRLRGSILTERCHDLRTALQSRFTYLTVYQVVTTEPGFRGDAVLDSFHILLGQTTSGEWMGIAPRIGGAERWREETERMAIASGPPLSRDLLPLFQTLDPILTGLEFSTTDYTQTFREFVFISRETPDRTLYELLDAIDFVVTATFEPFALHDDDPDCEAIDQLLQNNLSDLREYVIGSDSLFHVYTVGRTQEGDWAGVKAIAVWA